MGSKTRPIKVLYVCPWAHYSGHHPYAARIEPEFLTKAGVDVTLVTFCGITNNPLIPIPHYKVIKKRWRILNWVGKSIIPRWFIMAGETIATLIKAMRLYRQFKFDVIYLRDGEPFLFIPHLLSVPFRGYRWVVSLTAANLFIPKQTILRLLENPFAFFYAMALYLVNGAFWIPLYRLSLSRNTFIFVAQNEESHRGYETYQGGIFAGKVVCIPLGTVSDFTPVSKSEARKKLGLPRDGIIMLSFGAPNTGKNIEVVVKAAKQVTEIFVVHAGTQTFSLGSNPTMLTKKYELDERTAIFDYYVPEEEKPLFFCASDAILLSYTKAFKSTSSMLWEAAKYRLPVISSNANQLGKVVKEYNLGLLFEAEDAQSLVDAIRRFICIAPSEVEKMKVGCERFTDDFSYDKWAQRCVEVFKKLV